MLLLREVVDLLQRSNTHLVLTSERHRTGRQVNLDGVHTAAILIREERELLTGHLRTVGKSPFVSHVREGTRFHHCLVSLAELFATSHRRRNRSGVLDLDLLGNPGQTTVVCCLDQEALSELTTFEVYRTGNCLRFEFFLIGRH